jgi:hypothetical protein
MTKSGTLSTEMSLYAYDREPVSKPRYRGLLSRNIDEDAALLLVYRCWCTSNFRFRF